MCCVRWSVFCSDSNVDRSLRWSLGGLRATLLASALIFSTSAFSQTFVPVGAAPGNGLGISDPGSYQTFSGAGSAIVTDPNNPGWIIMGSVNGGIWSTTNAGASDGNVVWTPRTDSQLSLSVAALALDPTNSANLIAGIGPITNAAGVSGPLTGIQYSNNGGLTWTSRAVDGAAGLGITAAARLGDTLLAGSSNLFDGFSPGGLFRSTGGGAFQTIVLPDSDSNAPVTGIVRGTRATNDVFVAAGGGATTRPPTIYRGTIDGNSWVTLDTPGSALAADLATQSAYVNGDPTVRYDKVVRLAPGPDGTIAVAVAQLTLVGKETKSTLSAVYLSNDNGATWNRVSITGLQVNNGGQALTNLAIAVDPVDKKTVYVAGDVSTAANPTVGYYLPIYKLTLNADNTTTVTDLSLLNNTGVHADVRSITFDKNNQLIVVNDGGIYTLVNGTWRGLNGNLQIAEYYQVAYDSRNKRVGAAAQDNGVQLQNSRTGSTFSLLNGGDGINISFADQNGPNTIVYGSLQHLALFRGIIDSNTGQMGKLVSINLFDDNGAQINTEANAPFSAKFILNRFDQNDFVIGTKAVYTGTDTPYVPATVSVDIQVTKVGDAGAGTEISALAYGVTDNSHAILAGASNGTLWLSTDGTAATWGQKTDYRAQGGLVPTSVVFDGRTIQRFYVADGTSVWGTANTGTLFTNLNASLPASFTNPRALEFISQNGVNALVVGGMNSALGLGNQIVVASSRSDGTLFDWNRLGSGMPNAPIFSLYYSEPADVLVAGTLGRGAWALYDVTSFFQQATALWFGKADNDSTPIASQLTQGTDEDGLTFTRGLTKSGVGTLTIVDGLTASYQGATVVDAGRMVVNGSIASSSGVTVNNGATLAGSGTVPTTLLNNGGTLSPGSTIGTLTVNGTLTFGTGSTYLVDIANASADKTVVNATASLTGGTVVANLFTVPSVNRYNILTSASLNGTQFSGVRSAAASAFIPYLSYTVSDVYLNFTAALGSGATPNQNGQAVANGLNAYFNNGGTLTPSFAAIFGLSGASLTTALSQLSGQPGASVSQTGFSGTAQFINAIFDGAFGDDSTETATNFAATGDDDANAYAAKRARSRAAKDAYAAVTPRDRLGPPAEKRWNVWASAYGGNSRVNGDGAMGTVTTTSRIFGTVAGGNYRATPNTQIGFALGGAGSNFGLDAGLGSGRADVFNAAVYGKHNIGAAYVAGLLGYSWQDTTTDRTVTISGTDKLHASFKAQALAARLEGGWRYATPFAGVTPYSALQTTTFYLPAYGETATSGSSTFALNYASKAVTATRGELGARFDKAMIVRDGIFTLKAKTAWAHDWNTDRLATATFQTLPGATFTTNGARPSADAALISLGGEMGWQNGWRVAANFDGEFSRTTAGYAGKGSVRYAW